MGIRSNFEKLLTTDAMSAEGSAACLLCCPIGDKGVIEERIGKVGIWFVVNRRWRPGAVVEEFEGCEPIGLLYAGKEDSF